MGDSISGEIMDTPRVVNVPDSFAPGGKADKLVIDLATADGPRSLWLKANHGLQRAIGEAAKETGLAKGGQLAVRRVEDGEPTQKGYKAPHRFEAKYTPPAAETVSADSGDW